MAQFSPADHDAAQAALVNELLGAGDPVLDHDNGTKTPVTTSVTVLTPPAGCKWARISTDVDVVLNTSGVGEAVDDGHSAILTAGSTETIPVSAGQAVKALSLAGTATVRCVPLKARV